MKKSKKDKSIKIKERALTLDEVFAQLAINPTSTPGINNVVLTPISSEACLRHGINPDYLRKRNFETFHEKDQSDLDIQRLKFETYDRRRHELMQIASEEKNRIKKTNNCDRSMSGSIASLTPSAVLREQEKANSTLLEMEEKRLRKAKEKQKREILQLLQFEQKMEKMQAEMREKVEQEALAEEKKKERKQKRERRAAEERRLRELRRKAKEDAEEEMLRVSAREKFEKERQFQLEKEQQLLENKKRLREIEAEKERKQALLKIQNQKEEERKRREIEKKLEEREVKERERQIRIEKKRAMDQFELDQRRKQAADRIAMNKEAARRKEEERKRIMIEKRAKNEMKQQRLSLAREEDREQTKKEREAMDRRRQYQAKIAKENEEKAKAALLKKFDEDEKNVKELKELKEKDMAILKEERELHTQLKRENVERIKRMQEYKRLETMRKVSENDQRTEEMLQKREELAKARRKNAVEAKIRKDKLMQTLDKSKSRGGKALARILAQLSADDDVTKATVKKKKKKKRLPVSKKSGAPNRVVPKARVPSPGVPPAVIEIGGGIDQPPEAPSLLARIAEASEEAEAYVSPYAASPYASLR